MVRYGRSIFIKEIYREPGIYRIYAPALDYPVDALLQVCMCVCCLAYVPMYVCDVMAVYMCVASRMYVCMFDAMDVLCVLARV